MRVSIKFCGFFFFRQVAQRCFVALGNASMAFYLGKTMKKAEEYEERIPPGVQGNEVRARMALVNGDLK